jgi:hypothetical protein
MTGISTIPIKSMFKQPKNNLFKNACFARVEFVKQAYLLLIDVYA